MKKILLSTVFVVLSVMPIMAQWSTDSTSFKRVSPEGESNYGYEIKTTDDGLSYMYIHIPSNDNPSLRIQIIDKDGNLVLGDGGKELSSERNLTYTKVGQHLMTDREGNAIVALSDFRTGAETYSVYKVDKTGNVIWSKTLNNEVSPGSVACIKMVTSEDGGYVFAYEAYDNNTSSASVSVYVEKLNSDGTDAWDEPLVLGGTSDSEQYAYPYLVDAGSSQTILVYAKGANQDLYARLLDFDGTSVWSDEDVLVWQGGFTSNPLHTMMNVYQGADGSAVVAWMNPDASSDNYENRLSYILNDGTYGFPTGEMGTNVSNDTDYSRGYPKVYADNNEKAFYCIWQQFDQAYQVYHGLFMQKISFDGELLWGANGKAVVDMQDADTYSYYSIQGAKDGNFAVFYMKLDGQATYGTVHCYLTIYDKDGNMVQSPACFATTEETITNLESSQLIDGKYYLTNFDGYSYDGEVYMQRVYLDGSVDGIKHISDGNSGKTLLRSDVFSIDGSQKQSMTKGLNLVKETYSDGTISVKKQIK